MKELEDKLEKLRRRFRDIGSAVVAFSGGVDSALLIKVAHQTLGDKMLAVTAKSPSTPKRDYDESQAFCEKHNIPHLIVETNEFTDPEFLKNTGNRCYFCKKALYKSMAKVADSSGFSYVVEGTNLSDLNGHRPGYGASKENERVMTPLIDCGITKTEVRAMAKMLGLGEVSQKPATACLSSRVPIGTSIDEEALSKVDRAEDAIRAVGIKQVRVRHHGNIARIEVEPEDIDLLIEKREDISFILQGLGYKYITLDLKGYRPSTPDSIAGYKVRST